MLKRILKEDELYPNRKMFFKILRENDFSFEVIHPEGYNEITEKEVSKFSFIEDVIFTREIYVDFCYYDVRLVFSSFMFYNNEDFTKEDIDCFFDELECLLEKKDLVFSNKDCINKCFNKIKTEILKNFKED